jgi:hypothetical protein
MKEEEERPLFGVGVGGHLGYLAPLLIQ